MKHLALRSRSVRNRNRPFTAPGLGDRIHGAITGWVYGQRHGTPVTLHLTADKVRGGQFQNKGESWAEVIRLFPEGSLAFMVHPVSGLEEPDWLAYLRKHGIDAEIYGYGDFPGPYQSPAALDIAPYLKEIPPLPAVEQDIALPDRFVTVQWDSNERARTLPSAQRRAVLERYRAAGYKAVVVGGEAQDSRLRWSLACVAYAMSRAAFHVGVDSAFFHLAQLYMPWERIHLYNQPNGFYSHHALRALANGVKFNPYL